MIRWNLIAKSVRGHDYATTGIPTAKAVEPVGQKPSGSIASAIAIIFTHGSKSCPDASAPVPVSDANSVTTDVTVSSIGIATTPFTSLPHDVEIDTQHSKANKRKRFSGSDSIIIAANLDSSRG
jgi:hypothetical protein